MDEEKKEKIAGTTNVIEPESSNEAIIDDTVSNSGLQTKQSGATIDELNKTLQKFEEVKIEVKDLKKDFMTVFGVFASFVTFLSVEIQILKIVSNFWLLLGMSSFLLAGILLFSFSINFLVKGKSDFKDLANPISLLIFILLIVMASCFYIYFKKL